MAETETRQMPGRPPGRYVPVADHRRHHDFMPPLARGFPELRPRQPVEEIRWQGWKGGDNHPSLFRFERTPARGDEAFRSEMSARLTSARDPFRGADLFERLYADGIRIVLASSSHAEEVDYHLSLIACADLVSATTSSDDVENSKPCPDIFAAALGRVAPLGAEEVAVVGDTPWDAKAAGKLGLRVVGFRSGGFPDEALAEAGACELFDGPSDLLARFDSSVFGRDG